MYSISKQCKIFCIIKNVLLYSWKIHKITAIKSVLKLFSFEVEFASQLIFSENFGINMGSELIPLVCQTVCSFPHRQLAVAEFEHCRSLTAFETELLSTY